jgi:hypothetical protein
MMFAVFLANGLIDLVGRTRAVVSVSSDHVQVSICMRADEQENCTLALEVERGR